MKSKIAITYEIDNFDVAVKELSDSINDGFGFLKNTCGIIFCAYDMDHEAFLKKFKKLFPYDLIGCTTVASFESVNGFHEMCVTLLVLTADDCEFAAVFSDAVTPENVDQQIRKSWQQAQEKTLGDIKLAFSIPAYNLKIMLDTFTNTFNEIAPGVPFFGGLPSYFGNKDNNRTIFNEEVSTDKMALLAISGNVQPVFSMQSVTSTIAERKRTVTSAKFNTIYTVGGQKFTDYLSDIGLPVEKLTEGNNTITFVSNPVLVENAKQTGGFAFARTLQKIDLVEGSGTAIGEIPEGATISICSMKRGDIAEKAVRGAQDIKEKILENSSGYAYSTVLAVSCIGRYLLMSPKSHMEVASLLEEFPEGLNLTGFYGYGEMVPFCSAENRLVNFSHNETLVLCAF